MDTESKISHSKDDATQSLVTALNGLIHMCHDAHDGYMRAADGITSSAYKTMFAEYALQRSRFASQLANLVIDYGGDPDDDGHSMSLFPRTWTNIDPVLMGGDFGAIFAECEHSEDTTKQSYERVLEKKLTTDVKQVVKQQYQQIEEAHDRIRNLREAYYAEHKMG